MTPAIAEEPTIQPSSRQSSTSACSANQVRQVPAKRRVMDRRLEIRVRALSPQSTLDRGYAVVQRTDGPVVRDPDEATGRLRIRVARGEFEADRV